MPKKDKDDITLWRDRISHAQAKQKDFDNRYGYTRAMREYRGEYREVISQLSFSLSDIPIIPINEVKAFVRTFLPSVYSRDPIINVNPQGQPSVRSSKIFEKAINALWRDLKIKREIRRCIVDACLGPFGWIKIGYSAIFGEYETEGDKPKFEANQFIKNEEIFAVRESWKRIVYDVDAINPPYDCRWMAHKIIKPLEAVKNSGIYDNTAELEGTTISQQEYPDEKGRIKSYDEEPQSILWEIWDKDSNKVRTMPDGSPNKFLLKRNWPYKMEGFPFIPLCFDVNPDENYPQNFVGAWEPQLWEKIKLRSMCLDHLKRFGRQLAAEEGSLKPSERQKFEHGKTGSIIEYRKGKIPPTPIQYPPIQTDMYAIMNAVEYDKDNLSGQASIMRGGSQKTQSRTLGEVDRMVQMGEGRNADPQDLIEDFSENIAYALKNLMQEFITLPKFVKLTQKEASEIIEALGPDRFDGTGFTYTKDDIQGDFEIDIKAGSTLPLNRLNRVKMLDQILRNAPALGVQPNGRVAMTIGRNILSDLEMYEVEQAYEEEIAELQAQKQAMMQIAQMTGQGVASGGELPALGPQRGRPPSAAGQMPPSRASVPGQRTAMAAMREASK